MMQVLLWIVLFLNYATSLSFLTRQLLQAASSASSTSTVDTDSDAATLWQQVSQAHFLLLSTSKPLVPITSRVTMVSERLTLTTTAMLTESHSHLSPLIQLKRS